MERKQIFSIKKLKNGAASVLIGMGLIFLGDQGAEVLANESLSSTPQGSTTSGSTPQEEPASAEEGSGAQGAGALRSSTTPDYSGVNLSGSIVGGKTSYAPGEQIISRFKLDVSAPSKLENGSYVLLTLPTNEPVVDVQIGTSLPYEKISDTVYKIKTNEVPGGSYATINVSYKFDKYRTGRNSQTNITAQVYSAEGVTIGSASTVATVANTNPTGYPYVSVDSNNGADRQVLFETDAPGTVIDDTKTKELELKLTTTNKELAAVNKIEHEVTLPENVKVAQRSLDAGWRQEGNLAKFIRSITDAQPVFKDGNNSTTDTLFLNMRDAGTLEEFIAGKNFVFTDKATYTDKSGETNESTGTRNIVVAATNPYEDKGPGAKPDAPEGVNPLLINNFTRENSYSSVINTAISGVKDTDDDRRIITIWRSGATPTKIKELEITVDSDFDQKRSIEFYGIWARPWNAYAPWYAPNDLKTSNIFEVFTVNGTTETNIGEIAFKQGGGTSLDLPDGTTKVILRPKGEMEFTNPELNQIGVYLNQNLKGLDEAKKLIEEGKEVSSIVTARVSTVGSDKINEAISKTTLVDARTALKLVPRTGKIETVLSGNATQGFASGIEAYNYSPSGLGDRVYNTYTSHGYNTAKSLNDLGVKNHKIIVELPDGFTYAGVKDPNNGPIKSRKENVTTDDNYMNTGKRVVIINTNGANTRENIHGWSNEHWNWIPLDIAFNVANWVPTGTYPVKYTLVWDEDNKFLGLNPNAELDGNTEVLNTTTFTYEIPVSNTSATQLITETTDKNDKTTGYTTDLKNLAPNADIMYRFTLSNRDNSKLKNNEVLVTLPRVNDKNIVDTSISRNSQFDVVATGAATVPEGWTAYYSTTAVTGNADAVANSATLTADQVTDWSQVTAVKFVSNEGTTLNPGLSTAFSLPARVAADAQDGQVANLSAATKTDGQAIYNEANATSVTIKLTDIQTGNVKVVYEDTQGNTIKDTITAIENRAYTKDYNVDTTEFKPTELTGKDGKKYYFVKVKDGSAAVSGVIDSAERTVTYVYDLLEEEVKETKKVTRTIKYVDAVTKEEIETSKKEEVTLTRTNVLNKVTNKVTEGEWNTGSWTEQTSPTIANYGTPDKPTVAGETVTGETADKEVVVEYPQATEDTSKPTKQTVNFEGAGDKTPTPNVQDDYTFSGKTNKTTKTTTWTEEEHTYGKVNVPVVEGYYADKKEAGGLKVTPSNPEVEDKVTYKPLGKLVPKPEIPNDPDFPASPEVPYPNDPQGDPTKPGKPIVPNVPGYKPYLPDPQDPTKPGQPIEPGTEITPENPGEDTPIIYVKDSQKAIIYYVVEGTAANDVATKYLAQDGVYGKSGEAIDYTTAPTLNTLAILGYEVVTDGFTSAADKNFDKDANVDQIFLVVVRPKEVPVKPEIPTDPKQPVDPKTPKPGEPIDPETPQPTDPEDPNNPTPPTWTDELIKQLENVKNITRTVTYVDEKGNEVDTTNAPKVTDIVTFTRVPVVSAVDGKLLGYDTDGDGKVDVSVVEGAKTWVARNNDTTFDAVKSPVVPGYILKSNQDEQGGLVAKDGTSVKETTGLTEDSKDQDLKVIYVPVGSYVPKVPEGETPTTPTKYPNDPQDPSEVVVPEPQKPTNPNDPTSPKTPVIPHIPGYEPEVVGSDEPLKPVDPQNPEKGYIPPKPKDPTQDTIIIYAKVEQKAIIKYVVEDGDEFLEYRANLIGKSGEQINYSTEATIARLKELGYEVVTDGFTDALATEKIYDKDSSVDQEFVVVLRMKKTPVKPQPEPEDPKPKPENPQPKPIIPETPNKSENPPIKEVVTEVVKIIKEKEQLPNTNANNTAGNAAGLGLIGMVAAAIAARRRKEDK